jgi:PAS domain S-box-containing protein
MGNGKNYNLLFLTSDENLCRTVEEYFNSAGSDISVKYSSDLSSFSSDLQSDKYQITIADQRLSDVILSQALAIQKSIDRELPFLIITEKENQEEAAELIYSGASDYITTDNLARLMPVIGREIRAYQEVMASKKARQEIKELLNIIDSAEDEIYILNNDYTIKFANRKALKNLGYKMAELSGTHMQIISEELIPVTEEPQKSNRRITYYTKFVRKDGSKYPAEVIFQASQSEGKMSILAIVHDITEKENVKQQALILNKAIEASATAVTITDSDLNIFYINQKQLMLSGKARNELIGSSILDQFDEHSEVVMAVNSCLAGQSWVGEYSRKSYDGTEYTVLGSISPVFGDSCNVTNIILVEEDITERVRFKTQLQHAQKMETVGELTSGIAHDFTNMLTAIGGFASIMKRKMEKDNRFYGYVERIVDLTVRAKSLTQNLLTFSRKQKQAEKVINVNSLISSVSGFISMVIGSRLEVEIDITDDELNIMGDPVLLEQVIINLATNARDAVDNDGRLDISTSRTMISDSSDPSGFKEYAVISVKDNGCGIEESKANMIFEPFFTTKEEGKGTGLGLYIVHDIITKHGGMIECVSEIGKGTEFVIKLPITEIACEFVVDEDDAEDIEESATILLVEDEKIVRESLVNALEAYVYNVIEAVNGREAVEIYKEKSDSIDMVITDIVMPVLDGISAFFEMKKLNDKINVIFTTGYVGEAHKRKGFKEDEHTIILKPLLVKDLVKKIDSKLNDN